MHPRKLYQEPSHESWYQILRYWLPEMISICIITALPPLVDAYLIAGLRSTHTYGALGLATNLTHMLIKLSEAIPVAAIALIGRDNGAGRHAQCGEGLVNTFWTTCFLGIAQLGVLWVSAPLIFRWLDVPEHMIALGTPVLRLRAIGVCIAFLLWAFIGFMRAVKNTRTPMIITLIGTGSFLFFDYALITGAWGFPALGMYGSPCASIIQYSLMLGYALWYLLTHPTYYRYFAHIHTYRPRFTQFISLLWLGMPVMLDKASISFSYVWLSKMIAPLGSNAIASFDIIKNLERSAIMPAAAFAHVITFLVSNHIGSQDYHGARESIKKVLLLSACMVSFTLVIITVGARFFIAQLAPNPELIPFATPLLRTISIFVVFDFIQLVLAGALRGAGRVHTVMWGRFITCTFFFIPLSYYLSQCSFSSTSLKFGLLYGAFYLNTALMGLVFVLSVFRTNWYKKTL